MCRLCGPLTIGTSFGYFCVSVDAWVNITLHFLRCVSRSNAHVIPQQILEREAVPGVQDEASLVRRASEGVPGGITVDGFVCLMRLFIEKKQVR